ncbi:MAG: hypothetical protein II949_10815, partial [Prevotella sp.]|nr:hypothetical protein [Prevotella sp.]
MKKIFSILALALAAMTASAKEAGFDLTVGKSEKGTVVFRVNNSEVKSASEGAAVTMKITPEGGYVVKEVTNSLYTDWNSARAQAIDITTGVEMKLQSVKKDAQGIYTYTYTFTMPRANVEVNAEYDIEIPTPAEDKKDEEKEVTDVKLDMQPTEGEQPKHDQATGITTIPVDITGVEVPQGAPQEIVIEVKAQTQVGNNVFVVREIKADAFRTNSQNVKVTKVILPDTEEALKIAEGAMSPNGAPIEVQTPLALLDDYALMQTLKDNFEGKLITATAKAPQRFWTFSSGVDVLVPEGVTVYRAFMQDGTIRTLPIEMANASGIILANNGVLLSCNSLTGGAVYTFVANPGNQQSG